MKASVMKVSTIEDSTVEASTMKASVMRASTIEDSTVEASTMKASTVEDSTVLARNAPQQPPHFFKLIYGEYSLRANLPKTERRRGSTRWGSTPYG